MAASTNGGDGGDGGGRPRYYAFPPKEAPPGGGDATAKPTLAEVGGKALSLLEATSPSSSSSPSQPFPVPPGFVLTSSFFDPWLERIRATDAWKAYVSRAAGGSPDDDDGATKTKGATKADCDAVMERCRSTLSLDADQRATVEEAAKVAFGNATDLDETLGVVAVRSSSPEEDLAGTSFAGGYETTLGVTSATLEEAIVRSFASMFDHRVCLYKERHGMATDAPRIAVIVQRQIASDASGVAFSINPNDNCYDEIAISANFGLGESVVGGTVTPDTYVVDRFDPRERKIASKKVAEKISSVWLDAASGGTATRDNEDPTAQALTDEQILEVADLAARVEKERCDGSPVDVEWAYQGGKLYLLQARPVTAYVPLFPEMLTERGAEKKLYMDVIVMTQGFSDPMSTLGLDIWRTILARIKSTMSTDGKEGLVWNLHGREYFQISNLLKATGGSAMVNKSLRSYDKSIDRAFAAIDIREYTPSKVPEGAKGILWKTLAELGTMLPSMMRGMFRGGGAMADYIDGSNAIIDECHSDECSKDEPFGDALDKLITEFQDIIGGVGGLVAGMVSRAILHNWTFAKNEGAQDKLVSMCMDLNGNPTSEMGHFMVRLATYPEVQTTGTSEEFVEKLRGGAFSEEFSSDYAEYMKRFGCRGMREIDVATPRTHEDQAKFFDTLKAIDVDNNQILNVRERRDKAYRELLQMAREIGSEKQFVHHAAVIQSLLGYREHPKYILVVMVDRMRRHALNIARDFVAEGRLENVDQIFSLSITQVTDAQKDASVELLPLVRANAEPVEKVAHVKNWPVLIDSRGKIIRGVRDEADAEEGVIPGDPISPGTVKGKAKVLMSPYEKPLESGEILVARFTEPSWTPLFINAAGVVMEIGGPMQHGAIIARENATKVINDGDLLEVNGSSGTIKVIIESDEGRSSNATLG